MNEPDALELRERRRDWWSRMWAVAAGVLIGQTAFAATLYLLFNEWVETL